MFLAKPDKNSFRRIVGLLFAIMLVGLIASLVVYGTLVRWAGELGEDTLASFKAHCEKGEPLDGVWQENGCQFHIYSRGLYHHAICKTPPNTDVPKSTKCGVVVESKDLGDGYWWLMLKN